MTAAAERPYPTGEVVAVNCAPQRGTKAPVAMAHLVPGRGLDGDAHADASDRAISILPLEALALLPAAERAAAAAEPPTENLTIRGLPPALLTVGCRLQAGTAVIKICHIGKTVAEPRGRRHAMSRAGRFGRVIGGGTVRPGDRCTLLPAGKGETT